MNEIHFSQIVDNYMKKFELMNNAKSHETYKWLIARSFGSMMDEALASNDTDFPGKLREVQKMTGNLTDSFTQPFYGLYEFAKKEPTTVKDILKGLFASDSLPPSEKMQSIRHFLAGTEELRKQYFPGSFRYESTIHTATVLQTLYDPDKSYIVKPTHARKFADCIDFFDDWKSGLNTKLDVYYRMCDEVAAAIEKNDDLLKTHMSRYATEKPDSMHPDIKHHILVFDLIYCCSTYGLFSGITFNPPPDPGEVRLREERIKKATELAEKLEEARKDIELLGEAKSFFAPFFKAGASVCSKLNGNGDVQSCDGSIVTVFFPASAKTVKYVLANAISEGFLFVDDPAFAEGFQRYRHVLKSDKELMDRLSLREKEFQPYAEYLE